MRAQQFKLIQNPIGVYYFSHMKYKTKSLHTLSL